MYRANMKTACTLVPVVLCCAGSVISVITVAIGKGLLGIPLGEGVIAKCAPVYAAPCNDGCVV